MKKLLSLFLAVLIALSLILPAGAANQIRLQKLVDGTADYLLNTVKSAGSGEIGGEWVVMALARSGYDAPESFYQDYYSALEKRVQDAKGVLHKKKYTEYSRVILALTAIGKDPTNVGGYDLLKPLGDFDMTVWQGLNGAIWALIALDSGEYAMPVNTDASTQATRQMYVDHILGRQLADGGFSLNGKGGDTTPADPDITAMALQALAKYQDQKKVKTATDKAIECLSKMQDSSGGYASWGTANCESCAQVVVALCELGISLNDKRFVKNGHTLLDNLTSFRKSNGGFTHVSDGSDGDNQMSTEQGFYALVDALRLEKGFSSLYRMSGNALHISDAAGAQGLPSRNTAVKAIPVTKPGLTFSDIKKSANKAAIEALASREIINGMGDGTFAPSATMTRAQYAAIVVRALGLTPDAKGAKAYTDVAPGTWYEGYIGTASTYGIINGRGGGIFDPEGTITKQEAAVMTIRAAKLCGLETAMKSATVRDALCDFADYTSVADWAQSELAYCYQNGLLDASALNVEPGRKILRCEVAEMLYRMLMLAQLL